MGRRLHLYYSGSVQGVGFRYTAERAATSLGINGWVRNLPDGRVEVMCEGREPDLKNFTEELKGVFKEYIRDVELRWSDASGEFDGFDIQF
ncbi:MAG: acylphosphatase [Candidatus Omnitrophota bacterium]|nr:acylphosphatase [Candidatus Omnitrophota bacterium]